ncbi:MAG: hypothetical protein U0414_40105 [Polyangiaceae bacterium]
MLARKKTGPRPLPVRHLEAPRSLTPVLGIGGSAALVVAAAALLACGGATPSVGAAPPDPTECPRLAGKPAVPSGSAPVVAASAAGGTPASGPIVPNPDPPPLGGEPPMVR